MSIVCETVKARLATKIKLFRKTEKVALRKSITALKKWGSLKSRGSEKVVLLKSSSFTVLCVAS